MRHGQWLAQAASFNEKSRLAAAWVRVGPTPMPSEATPLVLNQASMPRIAVHRELRAARNPVTLHSGISQRVFHLIYGGQRIGRC